MEKIVCRGRVATRRKGIPTCSPWTRLVYEGERRKIDVSGGDSPPSLRDQTALMKEGVHYLRGKSTNGFSGPFRVPLGRNSKEKVRRGRRGRNIRGSLTFAGKTADRSRLSFY